jgi:hypothetical protein
MPEGSQFPAGSWGKGGADDPAGDPYTSMQHRLGGLVEDDSRKHWGDLEPESAGEEEDEGESAVEDTVRFIKNAAISGFQDLTPLTYQSQPALSVSGYQTPALVDIRKKVK